MKKGFIKISQNAVSIQHNISKLNERGVATDSIFIEKKFISILSQLEKGDTIVVSALQDICGGMKELLHLIEKLINAGIILESADEYNICINPDDTKTASLIKSLNLFRLNITAQNIQTGLNKAIDNGRRLGRPTGMTTEMSLKIKQAITLYQSTEMSIADICRRIDLNKSSFYHYIKAKNITRKKKLSEF